MVRDKKIKMCERDSRRFGDDYLLVVSGRIGVGWLCRSKLASGREPAKMTGMESATAGACGRTRIFGGCLACFC